MSVVVSTTDDKVKAAALACPEAGKVLETLFPAVFTNIIKMLPQIEQRITGKITFRAPNGSSDHHNVELRNGGRMADNIFLPRIGGYNWAIEDEDSNKILVLRKA